jgi:hypothetical protein
LLHPQPQKRPIACHRCRLEIKLCSTVHDCPYNKQGAGPDAEARPLLRLRFQTGYPALSTAPWLPEVTILE